MSFMKYIRSISIAAVTAAAMLALTGCGSWWASTSVGPDLYVGDYYPGYYPNYNPNYYPGYWNPGPALPPPGSTIVVNPAPARPPQGNPGGNNGGINGGPGQIGQPSARPPMQSANPGGGVGSPAQGGFRGEGSGATSRH